LLCLKEAKVQPYFLAEIKMLKPPPADFSDLDDKTALLIL
jgi:hypothetical protein